jgi:methylglutaconyl-CoA hydratase
MKSLSIETGHGIVRITLNRPERRNAFDDLMVRELRDAFSALGQDRSVRGVVLAAAGPVFCAGVDLGWMRPSSAVSEAQARTDAQGLVAMYRAIDECPCPVVGRIHGSAFGGGVGLVAVCDVAVASDDAAFSLSEVRLGFVPGVISPFLLRKCGASFVRRYGLTAETFTASEAKGYHLIHEVADRDGLEKRIQELADAVRRLAPNAVREAKALFRRLASADEADCWHLVADTNARARLSEEAREGMSAFLEKRPPVWTQADHGPRRQKDPSDDAGQRN